MTVKLARMRRISFEGATVKTFRIASARVVGEISQSQVDLVQRGHQHDTSGVGSLC